VSDVPPGANGETMRTGFEPRIPAAPESALRAARG
jgi:hypothetical protein